MTDCASVEDCFLLFFFAGLCLYTICAAHQQRGTFTQEYNISNGDESEAERLERLLVEEAVARRIEVSHVNKTAQLTGGWQLIKTSWGSSPARHVGLHPGVETGSFFMFSTDFLSCALPRTTQVIDYLSAAVGGGSAGTKHPASESGGLCSRDRFKQALRGLWRTHFTDEQAEALADQYRPPVDHSSARVSVGVDCDYDIDGYDAVAVAVVVASAKKCIRSRFRLLSDERVRRPGNIR